MLPYTQTTGSKFMDDIISGRIEKIGDAWFYTEWSVTYAQRPCSTTDNFATFEGATAKFEKRLADCRESWGHNGARFSETLTTNQDGSKSIRFRSIRKNGQPGTLTGNLYLTKINRTLK